MGGGGCANGRGSSTGRGDGVSGTLRAVRLRVGGWPRGEGAGWLAAFTRREGFSELVATAAGTSVAYRLSFRSNRIETSTE